MKDKMPKARIIYDNYNLDDKYEDMYEDTKQLLIDKGNPTPADAEIWEKIWSIDQLDFNKRFNELETFFKGKTILLFGSIGRWCGNVRGAEIFSSFEKAFYYATEDCDYIKIYDENGHFYIHCSHHDGNCSFEIKILTEAGITYYENWEDGCYSGRRTSKEVFDKLVERYSVTPRYVETQWGCKRFEYEPITKSRLIDLINEKNLKN